MSRLVGAILLLISAVICSFFLINEEKKRITYLGAFTELIGYIYKQIEAFNLPVSDILKNADKGILKLCGIDDRNKNDLNSIINEGKLQLDKKTRALLREFLLGLGRCYRDEQIRHCKYYYDELAEHFDTLKKEYPKRRRLIITLSLCTAFGLIILMI